MILDLTISENHIERDSISLIQNVRPKWDENLVRFKTFTDGITNKLVAAYVENNPDDVILIRIYGRNTDLLIDRKAEVNTMIKLSTVGAAPPLYSTFSNGICYGYVTGVTLDEISVRDDTVCRLVAQTFAKYHRLPTGGNDNKAILFPVLKRYLKYIPNAFRDPQMNERFQKFVPSKRVLEEELKTLEAQLPILGSPVVFCHNDALLKNIIYDYDKKKVTFIDYEYAGYNYLAFDIGNHFCEFSGMVDADFSLYPDRNFQLKWLRTYLEFYHENEENFENISDKQVEKLYVQVNKFALASHFMWGLWGLVQANNSLIHFDFLGFAIARLNAYFEKKEEFLSLDMRD